MERNYLEAKIDGQYVTIWDDGTILPSIQGGYSLDDFKEDVEGAADYLNPSTMIASGLSSIMPEYPESAEPTDAEQELLDLQLEQARFESAMQEPQAEYYWTLMGQNMTYEDGVITITPMTDEEKDALLSDEDKMLAAANQAAMSDYLVDQGINPIPDAEGNYVPFTSDEERHSFMTADEIALEELNTAVIEQELAALHGELPISAALERELAEYETTDIEETRRRLGSLDIASSAGIEAEGRRTETDLLTREAARYGDLESLESLRSSLAGSTDTSDMTDLYTLSSISSTADAQEISAFSGIPSTTTSDLLSYYSSERAASDIAEQNEYASELALFSSLIGAGGYALGSGV